MSREDILRILRGATAGYLSGADLAAKLGVSRAAIWKQVKALERDGFRIDAVPSKGYRLLGSPDLIAADDVARDLGTEVIGRMTGVSDAWIGEDPPREHRTFCGA